MKICRIIAWLWLIGISSTAALAGPGVKLEEPFYCGADVSLLPVLEDAGARFVEKGQPADLPTLFTHNGCNVFRLRLFVDPNPDYRATAGAVQNLPAMLSLARRVKATGALLLLDLHYSDTWADPEHQTKPRAWVDLHGEALQKQVYDYTVETLTAFKKAGVLPELVQVGNEITSGMLWPDGKLAYEPQTEEKSWTDFSALLNAGIRGVRAVQIPDRPIKVAMHIHGGGRENLPAWFFQRLTRHVTDFDLIGLSFYPGNTETLPILKHNLNDLARRFNQGILILETAYPNRPVPELNEKDLDWPTTPQGQRQFLTALRTTLDDVPARRGRGFVYWFPEAIELPKLWTWRGGAMALFDEKGSPLLAVEVFNVIKR